MKVFCTPFLLPVVLTSVAYATPKAVVPKATAPKKSAPAPAAAKPPMLPANSPLVAAQFKRMSKAYSRLGSFAVNFIDADGRGANTQRIQYTAYFGVDGRLGLKLKELDKRGAPTGNVQTLLYDGHEAILSSNGAPAQRRPAKDGTSDYSRTEDFFSSAFGGEFIGEVSKFDRDPKSVKLEGKYRIQPVAGGKTRFENDVTVGSGPKLAQVNYAFLVGASGLIESISVTGKQNGKEIFHEVATVSPPTAIDVASLAWEKFGPPPNPNFSMDAPSQEAFKRAAKLYGETKTFSTKISGTVQNTPAAEKAPPWNAEIQWERRGRVRLQSSSDSMTYAYDGSTSYVNADGKFHTVKTFTSTPDQMSVQMISTLVLSDPPFIIFNQVFLNLLQGKSAELINGPNGVSSRKVTLETGQTLDNLPCSIADEVVTTKTDMGLATLESHYWFADSDGRLLRVTTTLKQKDFQSDVDVRLIDQEFNPVLPDSTWKFSAAEKTP